MKIDGDLDLSGTMTVSESLYVDMDLTGSGQLNVPGTLTVDCDVEGAMHIVASTVHVEGDVSGNVIISAENIRICGDVTDTVQLNGASVIIEGDRGQHVQINSESLRIDGTDYVDKARQQALKAADKKPGLLSSMFRRGSDNKSSMQSVVNLGRYQARYEVESDGNLVMDNNKLVTRGATQTVMKVTIEGVTDIMEIKNGDINAQGLIADEGAEVILNGQKMDRNCNAGVDVTRFGGKISKAYAPRDMNGNITHRPMRPF